ncbi:MAG TPA: DNA methyltransferase [Polyangia bacterium]
MPTSSQVQVPAAGPTSIYCTLYHREAGFTELAEAELRALGGGHTPEPGIWLSTVPIRWATCGYTCVGGRQLAFAATLDALAEEVRALRLAAPRFSVETRRVPRRRKGSTAAKTRVADCIDGQVSVDDPQLRLLVVVSSLGYRVLVDTDADPGDADWLGARHKPHNHVVALPVRLAKAMLNLTVRPGDTVLDPFCGTGTIPLLAAWAGHRAYGSDISAAWVARAGENLTHFGREATLVRADARAAQQAADCIVSNLPYGVYCHLAPDALRAVLRNLARLSPRVTLVTSARIEDDLRAEGYAILRVIPVESERFERFVHIALSPVHGAPA